MMKKILIAFFLLVLAGGCGARLKGFSVGAMYLDANVSMPYGMSADIEEIVPVGLLNFEF